MPDEPRRLPDALDRLDGEFYTTRWSMVIGAGQTQTPAAAAALSDLCQRYWLPLYAYVRRRIADVHTAQDLTQDFFARIIEKEMLAQASPERGRFRSFLLTSLKNFLANEHDRQQAKKRGGGMERLSLDVAGGESRLNLEPIDTLTPERVFERQWALTLLELVMERLQAEYAADGKQSQFDLLKQTLGGERGETPFAEIAARLDIREDHARQLAQRLKKRYRELLRQEVAETVALPSEVDDELRSLFAALS